VGGGKSALQTLFGLLDDAVSQTPDARTGKNVQYSLRDTVFSAFSVFYTQSPSFLEFQRSMQETAGRNNVQSLFGVVSIPTDNQIRNILDPIEPEHLEKVYQQTLELLWEEGILKSYRCLNETVLIALDGTWAISSDTIHCDHCMTKTSSDGSTVYYHSAITPVMVKPGENRAIPLIPEFMGPQDGKEKQDCENAAAKRWLGLHGKDYGAMGATYLGDDLYSKQPICEAILDQDSHFLFTCKYTSHKYLAEWVHDAEEGKDIGVVEKQEWTGRKRIQKKYRFMNGVPLKEGADALKVNWVEMEEKDELGKTLHQFAYITDHEVTAGNVEWMIECGRARWKVENENNNTLKTKGYNFEHNFGHGKRHLANLLLMMNILAFLFHTVLQYLDRRYMAVREKLGRRMRFFQDVRTLTTYMYFAGWDEMMRFMMKGLELEDPDIKTEASIL
jgi:hypothetical protein